LKNKLKKKLLRAVKLIKLIKIFKCKLVTKNQIKVMLDYNET